MKTCKLCKKQFEFGKYAFDSEKKAGLCTECLHKPFEITSVCRMDLLDHFTPEQVGKFDDAVMERLASKMADAYCDSDFWQDAEIIGEYLLEDE